MIEHPQTRPAVHPQAHHHIFSDLRSYLQVIGSAVGDILEEDLFGGAAAWTFGAGLLLRFTLLNGLAAPDGSLARRVFASALEGLTPGGLGLEHHAPATGYAAFVALLLYVGGLVLLPGDYTGWEVLGATDRRRDGR